MMLRNSERSTFKTCRHRWEWTYLDGRQSRDAPHALRFGDLIHRSLEPYYKPGTKRGPHPAKTFEELYQAQVQEFKDKGFNVFDRDAEKWESAFDLGRGMLNGYVERYKDEDQDWEVVASEQTFQLPVVVPRRLGLGPDGKVFRFKMVGTFDGVWRHRKSGVLIFKEFKTAAAIKLDGLPMDEQASCYWTYGPRWLVRKGYLKEGELPSKIMYTYLRKSIPNPDHVFNDLGQKLNKDGSVSKVQAAPYFSRVPVYRDAADRQRAHERICQEALMIARARSGQEPLIKNPGPLHMPNCMGCAVKDACELHETGGDYSEMLKMTMSPWNPYASHELPERH